MGLLNTEQQTQVLPTARECIQAYQKEHPNHEGPVYAGALNYISLSKSKKWLLIDAVRCRGILHYESQIAKELIETINSKHMASPNNGYETLMSSLGMYLFNKSPYFDLEWEDTDCIVCNQLDEEEPDRGVLFYFNYSEYAIDLLKRKLAGENTSPAKPSGSTSKTKRAKKSPQKDAEG